MGHSQVGISDPNDGTAAKVLATAPVSDTGQAALAVRIISQLGASSGGGPVTIVDGGDVTLGALADAVALDASGSVNAHLRGIIHTLLAGIAVTNAGTFAVQQTVPTAIAAFLTANVMSGTRVQLASNTGLSGAVLEAPSTNTGIIYVGASNVSATVYGAQLQPGQSVGVALNNSNLIYFDASVSGDKLAFLGS